MKHLWIVAFAIMLALTGCSNKNGDDGGSGGDTAAMRDDGGKDSGDDGGNETPNVTYVTNGIASFWEIAEKGAKDAGKEFKANVKVVMPPKGVADQQRMVEEVLAQGTDGMAISPIDPDNQGDLFKAIAEKTNMITHDSDAPDSGRLCYVGMDNYTAGRMCGELVKRAMPGGGSVMILVGRLEQANARLRRQGVIDELLDRSQDSKRYDEPSQGVLRGKKYTVLDTRTDNFDLARAKANAQEAITKHPDLGCMVGLFAYNPPKILEAVKEADKLGKIRIVSFDEHNESLQGIKDGHIYGTIVQDPYKYGYESVRILAGLARGDKKALPETGFFDIPARVITKSNVDEFWTELKGLMSK